MFANGADVLLSAIRQYSAYNSNNNTNDDGMNEKKKEIQLSLQCKRKSRNNVSSSSSSNIVSRVRMQQQLCLQHLISHCNTFCCSFPFGSFHCISLFCFYSLLILIRILVFSSQLGTFSLIFVTVWNCLLPQNKNAHEINKIMHFIEKYWRSRWKVRATSKIAIWFIIDV